MQRVGRFLFVVWDAGGNVVPAAGLAAALVENGHDVRVVGPAVLQSRFVVAGARFRPLQRARPPHSKESDISDENLLGWTRFISGKRLADDVLDELRSEPTDVVLIDAFLSAALAAAEKVGVPAVPLVHVLYAPSVDGPVATQWDPTRPMVEFTRRQLGIPELDPSVPVMAGLWSRNPLVFACVPQSFDFPLQQLPPNVRYVGPMLDGPRLGPRQAVPGRVLVSFSTTVMRGQGALLQRTFDALATLHVDVVCTLGGVPIEGLSPPPNVSIFDWIEHRELLPQTDVMVTHAGLSTVMSALATGVPLVCLPMGRDQPLNAQRVAALELGIALSPEAPIETIRGGIVTVLESEIFRQQAAAMAANIDRYGNGALAVQELEALL